MVWWNVIVYLVFGEGSWIEIWKRCCFCVLKKWMKEKFLFVFNINKFLLYVVVMFWVLYKIFFLNCWKNLLFFWYIFIKLLYILVKVFLVMRIWLKLLIVREFLWNFFVRGNLYVRWLYFLKIKILFDKVLLFWFFIRDRMKILFFWL